MSTPINIPVLANGTYRHNKSGKLYEVIGVAKDTESDSFVVVYKPQYEHESGYELFTRPYKMFVENVQLGGRLRPRFEKNLD